MWVETAANDHPSSTDFAFRFSWVAKGALALRFVSFRWGAMESEDVLDSGPSTLVEDEVSDEIVIQDEASLPEDGKVYPKEAHPNAGKSTSRPAGLLPGGGECFEKRGGKKRSAQGSVDVDVD